MTIEKGADTMEMNLKHRIASGAFALALLGGSGASVAAQQADVTQVAGASGLVAAVVEANDVVDVRIVDSFNNLRALNNVLNNSPILSNNDVMIGDVLSGNDIDVAVLDFTIGNVTVGAVLSENNLTFDDIVAVVQLVDGGVVIVV